MVKVVGVIVPYLGADTKDECDELMAGLNASCRKEGRNGQAVSRRKEDHQRHRQLMYLYNSICKEPSAPVSRFFSADLCPGPRCYSIHDS